MQNLFIKTSNVLRDNLIVELQKNNDYLRNKLSNINLNPFFGYKVKIESHLIGMSGEEFPETIGTIYSLVKSNVWILYNDAQGNRKMNRFYINNIDFIDERFDKYFSI